MATLETQYKNWLKENEPITYSEWLEKFSEIRHLDKIKVKPITAVEFLVNELNLEGYDHTIELAKKMEKEQISNQNGHTLSLKPTMYYEIDFDKVETVEDIIRILKVLNINFPEYTSGIDEIKDLLKEK